MADRRFFSVAGPFSLGDIAAMTGAQLSDPARVADMINDVAPLDTAHEGHLSFFDNRKYLDAFKNTKASACFSRPELAGMGAAGVMLLLTKNPHMAYAVAASAFYPERRPVEGVRAASATIDPSAVVADDCVVEHGAVIGANVKIGSACHIGAHAVISAGVEIGDHCDIGSNVYISHALIGARVRLGPGVCVGKPGFGFAIGPQGFLGVPQLGRVIIEDDVDIGANTTVDRGAGPDTIIGQGTRIDNLVQVGHNVRIGKYCAIAAQAGISGSTQIGDRVMIGGQAGLAGHLKIGSSVKIAGQSGVLRDIPDGEEHMGSPAVPIRQNLRQATILAKLADKQKKGDL